MPIISPTAISPHRIGGAKNWSSYWATLLFDIGYSHPMLPGLTIDKVGGVWTITSHTIDDFRKTLVTPIVKYVDAVNGLDTNNGDSAQTAYKTITKLMTVTWDRAYLAEGNYAFSSHVFSSRDHEIIGTGKVTIARGYLGSELTWTDLGGGVYSTPLTAFQTIIENAVENENGDLTALAYVANPGLVTTTPGSYYWHADEDVLYVHRSNGASPNTEQITINWGGTGVYTEYAYAENVIFLSNFGGLNTTATAWKILLKNCKLNYGRINASGNIWMWLEGITLAISRLTDLFNIKEASGYNPSVVEVGCKMYDAGKTYPTTTHITNTSTTHHSVVILRINGEYYESEGVVVHDVNQAVALNIGCYVHDSVSGDTTHKACFGTAAKAAETSKVYLYDCTTSGDCYGVVNLSPGTAHIYARDCNIHSVAPGTTLETF